MSKIEQLMELKKECLDCRLCKIGGKVIDGNLSNVFSNMCLKARIMVIGQNPGLKEIEQKIPFVGPSGKFFDKAVKEVLNLDRMDLYISNCVRCFSPENRKPNFLEIENCRRFLDREIEIIKPSIIITLGNPSMKQIIGCTGIMKQHGRIHISPRYKVEVFPLFHPSPLNMNQEKNRKIFYDDLKILRYYLFKNGVFAGYF